MSDLRGMVKEGDFYFWPISLTVGHTGPASLHFTAALATVPIALGPSSLLRNTEESCFRNALGNVITCLFLLVTSCPWPPLIIQLSGWGPGLEAFLQAFLWSSWRLKSSLQLLSWPLSQPETKVGTLWPSGQWVSSARSFFKAGWDWPAQSPASQPHSPELCLQPALWLWGPKAPSVCLIPREEVGQTIHPWIQCLSALICASLP